MDSLFASLFGQVWDAFLELKASPKVNQGLQTEACEKNSGRRVAALSIGHYSGS